MLLLLSTDTYLAISVQLPLQLLRKRSEMKEKERIWEGRE